MFGCRIPFKFNRGQGLGLEGDTSAQLLGIQIDIKLNQAMGCPGHIPADLHVLYEVCNGVMGNDKVNGVPFP